MITTNKIEGADHTCNELSSQMPACLGCIIMLRLSLRVEYMTAQIQILAGNLESEPSIINISKMLIVS